ncbi:MlaD family protein [Mycobacterium spongiae]|uniref:MCE family protein n=1 Tax=Mycobacterium spongiae TaxID=886343 RepID=A0A975JZ49_9MYCO|nr:MlaD family protein [Mycobacterium spongiae]QUR67744.1 MCE family protein [Mycobacterium spongiae]
MTNPLEWPARGVVGLIRALARHRILVSCVGLVATLVVAFGYVAIGGLGINPLRTMMSVRVLLPESGGLLANQDVTVRGIPIGRVTSVNLTHNGVEAVATIDASARIPLDSPVRVAPLSPAGEQYLDFRPTTTHGPFVTDGTVIGQRQATVPVSLARIIDDSHGALAQLDETKLSAIVNELRVGRDGPQKLAAILDGTIFLTSTLDSVLPQTVSLLRNTRVAFTVVADVAPGLRQTSINLGEVLSGVNAMDGGFRTLLDRGSGQLATFDNLIADNRENMVQLLGNLTTLSQLLYMRIPALQNLWRPDHGPLIDRLATAFRDGGVWGIGEFYPKYRCDYNVPRRAFSQADFPEPYRYTYCDNPDPSVLIRGARNAPRPPGDDTAGPPPGFDPLEQTDATPVYPPYTLPTTYAGPPIPAWVPN